MQILSRKTLLVLLIGALSATVSPAAAPPRPYVVVLSHPSVGAMLESPRATKRSKGPRRKGATTDFAPMRKLVESQRMPVVSAIRSEGVQIAGSVGYTLNAVFVWADQDQVRRLRTVDGVERVVRARRFRPLLDRASSLVRAPEAHERLGGSEFAGEGFRIAVIDTGIDVTHAAFRDNGLEFPPGFPKGWPDELAYTNRKIIAARSYVHLLSPPESEFSRPDDPTPRDRVGHGTAAAMIAAGRRVNSPVGSMIGVAPEAFLGNYKIFGAPDVNEFSNDFAILAAIDDAVLDGMDILSMSFGGVAQFPFDEAGEACSDDPDVLCDPVAAAAESAVLDFGAVVVAAAGNAGAFGEQAFPALNTIDSPGSAASALTVGASLNLRQLIQSVRFGSQSVTALSGTGPEPSAPVVARGADGRALSNGAGCSELAPGALAGMIVVFDRGGGCDFEAKVENAASAGALGVVIVNLDGEDQPFVMGELETTDIPAFMVGHADGDRIRASLAAPGNSSLTLDPTLTSRDFATDQVAPYSSRGPTPLGNIKPDIIAPGTFIYSAAQGLDPNGDAYSETGFVQLDGTSFAAPFASGAAALVWQANPSFFSTQVRSALINTAAPVLLEGGELARLTTAGMGLLDVAEAVLPVATVEPPTIGFGFVEGAAFPIDWELLLSNEAGESSTFRLTVIARDADSAAQLLINGASMTTVQMEIDEELLIPVSLEGSRPAPGAYEGIIVVERVEGGLELNVPYYYVVGDDVPYNSLAISGTGVVGTVNEPHPELLVFKAVDRHGVPLVDLPASFSSTEGGGAIVNADPSTDFFGVAAADVDMGPDVRPQNYLATAGGLDVPFFNRARAKPRIGGAVNGASFEAGAPVAPGSILSIFGEALAELIGSARRTPLPLALKHVSVSFDFPETGLSVPGRLFFISPGQLNVQVPWELAGLNFALMKVRIEDSASTVFTLALADYAPGVFEFDDTGSQVAAATHANGSVITSSNPAASGETIVIYATGLGPVDKPVASGEPAPPGDVVRTLVKARVFINGREATVEFCGLAPGFVGLYQINVRLPTGLAAGEAILTIEANGVEAPASRISVK